MPSEILARVTRDSTVESLHRGSLVIADPHGNLWGHLGNPDSALFLRSATAPFVAMLLVESGAADALQLDDRELALVAGAHNGEPKHIETLRELLHKAQVSEEILACTPALPLHGPTALRLACQGELPRPLYSPCSGKHAGMLALCNFYGWPTAGYLYPEHPLQQLLLATYAQLLDVPPERLFTAPGNCGAPSPYTPLTAVAAAYAKLASARPNRSVSLYRIATAMQAHPDMVAGSGRFDTDLMELSQGRILSRQAGEGLQCFALVEKGLGIALKVEDGSHRPVAQIARSVLKNLGLMDDQALTTLLERHSPPGSFYGERSVSHVTAEINLKWTPPHEIS